MPCRLAAAVGDDPRELVRVCEERQVGAIQREPLGLEKVGGAALDFLRRVVGALAVHDGGWPATLPEALQVDALEHRGARERRAPMQYGIGVVRGELLQQAINGCLTALDHVDLRNRARLPRRLP